MRTILIADPNTGFAAFIAEELRRTGHYRVVLAGSGAEAIQQACEIRPELAVVDAEVTQGAPLPDFIRQLRQDNTALPVVLIPVSEADVPTEVEIQGTLPKPFFLPDLAPLVRDLLGEPPVADAPPETPPPPAPVTRPARAVKVVISEPDRRLIDGHVQAMSHALRDEPVLLTQKDKVIAIAPRLSQTASAALAQVVTLAWETNGLAPRPLEAAPELIRFMGESDSTRYMLYSVNVADNLALSVALRRRIPLPIVRRITRDTAAELAKLLTSHPEL
jgi:CheY-like chemotaxis protein